MSASSLQGVSNPIPKSTVSAKGDLIAGIAENSVDKLSIGQNNSILVANSGESTGMNWTSSLSSLTINSSDINSAVLLSPGEKCNVVASSATGTINFDILTSTIWYYTSDSSADHTINFRGNSTTTLSSLLEVGNSISAMWLNTNGATAYLPTVIQIDGSTITPKWANGEPATTGNASSIDAYSFTIIKTSSSPTYVVFAGQGSFS